MTSKLMTLAFVGALALSALTTNALAATKGNAHSPGSTAVPGPRAENNAKRVSYDMLKRQTSSSAVASHAINGKKK